MSIIAKPNTPVTGGTISAPDTNANLDAIFNDYNGNITTANISASAAIANSKLNLASISQAVALAGGLTMTARQIDEAKGANVAAVAGTTTIWVTDGNFIHVTGAETITSFGTAAQAGIERTVVFDGACVLTHNATSLILPTAANITCAAGDVAIVRAETTANARVTNFYRKDGTALVSATAANALSGSVIQTVTATLATVQTGTTTVPNDDSIPQSGEGTEFLTASITPNNTSNTLLITFQCPIIACSGTVRVIGALFQDATAGALSAGYITFGAADQAQQFHLSYKMAAGTTSSTTFKIRIGPESASTVTINGESAGRKLGGVAITSIVIQEIKA